MLCGPMEPWQWSVLLRPFIYLAFGLAIVLPLRLVLRRYVPEGRFKRLLFKKWDGPAAKWYETAFMIAIVVGLWAALFVYMEFTRPW